MRTESGVVLEAGVVLRGGFGESRGGFAILKTTPDSDSKFGKLEPKGWFWIKNVFTRTPTCARIRRKVQNLQFKTTPPPILNLKRHSGNHPAGSKQVFQNHPTKTTPVSRAWRGV